MSTNHETEHQELFCADADLSQPVRLHVPSALGTLNYYVCLRVPAGTAARLEGARLRLQVGGLRPDDVTCAAGDGVPTPSCYASRVKGMEWVIFARTKVSRGDGVLTFEGLPADLTRADVLLCTWPRFVATGQADDWLACQSDPLWAPSGIPLGGIGCGKVEMSRDGRFRNFSGNNNQDMPFEDPDGLDGAFLSVDAGMGETVLATRPVGELPPCRGLETDLAFPQAVLRVDDLFPGLDVSVRLAGCTVPHEVTLSALPCVLVRWELHNRSEQSLPVTCRLAWPNLVGMGGGIDEAESQTGYADGYYRFWDAPEKHVAEPVESASFIALRYGNAPSPVCPAADGFHYVAARRGDGIGVDTHPRRGSVRRRVEVAGHTSCTVDMVLCWEMPHWVDTLHVDRGLYWQNSFAGGMDMMETVFDSFERILEGGAALRGLMASSKLPPWLGQRLVDCGYPLVTNSVFYRDGRFSINEGPTEMCGCYGTIDQRLGAHPATQLFYPGLNRQELDEFAAFQSPDGGVNHDLGHGNLERGPVDMAWPDLTCSFILQHARHAWSTGDSAFEDAVWPRVRHALERHALWAEEGNGVAQVGSGLGTSYDGYHYYGTTSYMATLWLAALAVSRRWAAGRGEDALTAKIDRWAAAAQERLEADLWNGRYYRAYGSEQGPVNENCHAGMLAGQAYARLLAGEDVLPAARLDACAEALLAMNLSDAFRVPPDEVAPDGTCAVEYGWLPYVECFGLAALAGRGDRRILPVWERMVHAMSGKGAHPCDTRLMYQPLSGEPSWGAYYMTAPASWIVYDALLDFFFRPADGVLRLGPCLPGRVPVVHPRFWGMADVSADGNKVSLEITRVCGEVPVVRVLEVPAGTAAVRIGDTSYATQAATTCYAHAAIPPVDLEPGTVLTWERV